MNCVAKKLSTCEIVTDAYSTCFECEAERCESKLDSENIKLSDSHSVTAKLSCQEGGDTLCSRQLGDPFQCDIKA